MSELDQLTQIISTILGQDNQARRENENLLVQLRTRDLNQYVLVFANLLNASPRKDIRTFCILHLRRLLSDYASDMSTSQWHLLTNEVQSFIKAALIEILLKESENSVRKILCDLIGELVATIKTMSPEVQAECPEEGRQWDSIMQNLWTFLSSGDINLMASGLKILGILFRYCSADFVQHKEQLIPIIKQALEHDNFLIKARAVEALSEYLENADSKECKIFVDLTPLVVADMLIIIDKDEDMGVDVLANLTDMIEIEAKVFKNHFRTVFDALINIAQNNQITTSALRENALETLVVLVEKFPKLSGKQENLVKNIYEAIFSYMITCVADPDKEWLSPPEGYLQTKEENESQEFSVKYCMDLFNRVIACLGQETTLPTLSSMLQDMVGTNNWRYKYSALMALSQVGEHMGEIVEMDPIVGFTLNFFKDEHPKVRYAALHCVGQLSDDKCFEFQKRYSVTIVPAIIGCFNDPVPRVLGHSLAALTNFLEGCSQKGVEGIIAGILEPCLAFLENGISLVKENSISTIAALASAAKGDFTPYWQRTADIIFNVLKNVHQHEYKQLRGQSIECLTIIGSAVGKEEFRKAAGEIIQTMIYIQQNHVEETDPQKAYLLAGWQRLSLIFEQEFTPYLKDIIPSLFSLIERTIKNYEKKQDARYDSNNDDNEEEEETDAKGLLYRANTSESEEVAIAVKMIKTFLEKCGEGYLPYVEKTSQILGYLLSKSKNDNVRLTCATALPGVIHVLRASKSPEKDIAVAKTSNIYLNLLWTLYSDEIDIGNMVSYIISMQKTIEASGRYMDDRQIAALSDNILSALKESDSRKGSNQEQLNEDPNEIDEDQFNAIQEDNDKEEDLQCTLADLIGALFMTHQELTLPLAQIIFKQVLPNAFNTNSTPKVLKFGLKLVNGMVQHLGLGLIPGQLASLAEIFIKFIVSPHPEVRDTAALGMGILAEKTKENFQPLAELFLKALITGLTMKPRKEEDQRAYWRARIQIVAALGKVIKHQSQYINVKEVIQIWFKNLPLSSYVEEVKIQHEMLVDIILDVDPSLIFGDNGQNLPYAVKIFAQLVHTRLCFETFQPKMKKIIEGLMANPNTKTLLENAVKNLEPDLQAKLQKALEQN